MGAGIERLKGLRLGNSARHANLRKQVAHLVIESREGRYGSSPGRLRAEQKWLRAVHVLEHKCLLKSMYVHSGNHGRPTAGELPCRGHDVLPTATTTTMTQMHVNVNVFLTPKQYDKHY